MAKLRTPNAVRFAWWGAEEAGLQGSTFYVNNLSAAERADIALYLNFDMIASPNYTFGVYDGDDSAQEGSGPGPAGSAAIEDVFEEFFAARGETTKASDFTGRSDYGPFIAVGIPAGGLFTGAETIKTAADVALWGGLAGQQMDVCYHDPATASPPSRTTPRPVCMTRSPPLAMTCTESQHLCVRRERRRRRDRRGHLAHDTSTVNGDAGAASVKVSAVAAGTGNHDIHGHARK